MLCSWIFSAGLLISVGKWRMYGSGGERRGCGRHGGREDGGIEDKMIKGTSSTTLLAAGYYFMTK